MLQPHELESPHTLKIEPVRAVITNSVNSSEETDNADDVKSAVT